MTIAAGRKAASRMSNRKAKSGRITRREFLAGWGMSIVTITAGKAVENIGAAFFSHDRF